jgi:hypothetical protein
MSAITGVLEIRLNKSFLSDILLLKMQLYFFFVILRHCIKYGHSVKSYVYLFTWWPSLLAIVYPGSFPGVKGMGREVDQSPPSNADVKNEWSCNSIPPLRHHGVGRDKFTSSFDDSTTSWPMTRTAHVIYVIT